MNNIENKIKSVLLQDIELPSKYKYMIRNTLTGKNEKRVHANSRLVKILATACVSIIIITSVVYAKEISNFVYHFFNNNKGMDLAINEGYIDEPNIEVNSGKAEGNNNGNIIDASNTKITVGNMLMDDYNLSFTFSVKLDENIDVSKIIDTWFSKMLITDENKKIIYCTDKNLFDKYCSENNLNYEYDNFNKNHINNEINHYMKSRLVEDNTLEVVYNFNACIYPYPKSKKLYIDIMEMTLSKAPFDQDNIILEGNWDINLDVSEKFYNREATVYTVKSCSDENITITEAGVYNTGMVLEFTSKDEPIWNEEDSVEIQREKLWKFKDDKDDLENKGIKFINDEYVKNENGDIFRPVESNSESSGTIYEYNGNFKHWQTFDMIKSNATDKLTVYIDLFLQKNRRLVVIELERYNK